MLLSSSKTDPPHAGYENTVIDNYVGPDYMHTYGTNTTIILYTVHCYEKETSIYINNSQKDTHIGIQLFFMHTSTRSIK